MTTAIDSQAAQSDAQNADKQSSASSSTPSTGEMVEKKRLDGALQKIEELTITNRILTEKNTELTQRIAQSSAEFSQKEGTWKTQLGEFEQKLTSAEAEKGTLSGQLSSYKQMEMKIKLINEMKRPELYAVLDVIPDAADEAAMRASIERLGNFASSLQKAREDELTAGITKTESNTETKETQLPTTEGGWQEYINSFELGSKEREAAYNAWHSQLFKQ